MKKRILFVCGGNTCRSPMAAAIASTLWRESVLADSAGVAAGEGKAASTAIQVIREDFGVDLSAHVPRDVEDLDLSGYDVIVALSGAIGDELRSRFAVDERRLVVWNVARPLRGID